MKLHPNYWYLKNAPDTIAANALLLSLACRRFRREFVKELGLDRLLNWLGGKV